MIRRFALATCFALAATALPADAGPLGYSVQRTCNYTTRVLPGDTDQTVVIAGFATATGPKVPYFTQVTCRVENTHVGGGDAATTTTTLPGGATAAFAVVGGFDPVLPIRVCSSAWALFGPDPVVIVNAPQICF